MASALKSVGTLKQPPFHAWYILSSNIIYHVLVISEFTLLHC
jgi:hypothetical protein